MDQNGEQRLDSYLNKGGIYLEIYYLLLKLAKPDSRRYRLKVDLDEIFSVASNTCNEIYQRNHPEASFEQIWYGVRDGYRRYETDLIFSVVYTLLKCVPVKNRNFIAVFVEIEEKNSKDDTYFPHFQKLVDDWLKDQKETVSPATPSQVEVLLKQIETLQKENDMLKMRNADLEEKVKDKEFYDERSKASTDVIELDSSYYNDSGSYSIDDLLAYAKSRQSYVNSSQIMNMLSTFIRKNGTNEQWEKFDETERYLLNRDGGSINIETNLGTLTNNEKGGFVLNLSSPDDKQRLVDLLKNNNISLIEK